MWVEERKKNNSPNQTENVGWRPLKYTPEELEQKANEYFKHCEATLVETSYWKKIPLPKTLSWLCKWLKVSKDYISEKIKDEKFSEITKLIKIEVENDIELNAMLWFLNPTIASRNLSANFDWREKTEVDNNIKWSLETNLNEEQMRIIANRVLNGKSSNTDDTKTS